MIEIRGALPAGALCVCAFLLFNPPALGGEPVTVKSVIDGDSLLLDDGRELRLIGVNAPEFGSDKRPAQPLAREARERLAALIEGKRVEMSTETEPRDRYGRWLVHLRRANGEDVAEIMLRAGLAWMIAVPPNVDRVALLQAAEAKARTAGRGVWAQAAYRPRAAEALDIGDTGFAFVTGVVRRVGKSRHDYYLDLAPRLSVQIPREDWQRWFTGEPRRLAGRRVTARGWISARDDKLRMRVSHPAMLTFVE